MGLRSGLRTLGRTVVRVSAIALLATALLWPDLTRAAVPAVGGEPVQVTVEIPDIAKQYVPEQDMVQMLYLVTAWKTSEMMARLEALDEVLTPALKDMAAIAGVQVALPEVTKARLDIKAKLNAIGTARTTAEAQQRITDFAQSSANVATLYASIPSALQPIERQLSERGAQMGAKISARMAEEAKKLSDSISQRVQAKVQAMVDQETATMAAQIQAYAESVAAAAVASKNQAAIAAIPSQVQAYASQLAAEITARV
jgi:ribosome-associated translation inhibitor RaiA